MPFTIKDVNCEFLLSCPVDAPSMIGDRRAFDPLRGLSISVRESLYGRTSTMPNPVPGIVVGYETTALPQVTNPVDHARYAAANRASFEVFNYTYKVFQPGLYGTQDASLLPEDFEKENIFKRKVGAMRNIGVSLSANQVQGAIPPGTYVKVKYEDINTLKSPQIVEIGEKIFDIASAQKPPPGEQFMLGSEMGPATALGNVPDPALHSGAPTNPNVNPNDISPLTGKELYAGGVRNTNMGLIDRIMIEQGIANRYTRIAIMAAIAKESGLVPQDENFNYTAARLTTIWPGKFPSEQAAIDKGYVNPTTRRADSQVYQEKLANDIYGGRYGNGNAATGDGWKYRGRGFNQITFKGSYERYANKVGINFVTDPQLMNVPENAALAAVMFLKDRLQSKYSAVNPDFATQEEANIAIAHANAGWGRDVNSGPVVMAINNVNDKSHYFV